MGEAKDKRDFILFLGIKSIGIKQLEDLGSKKLQKSRDMILKNRYINWFWREKISEL